MESRCKMFAYCFIFLLNLPYAVFLIHLCAYNYFVAIFKTFHSSLVLSGDEANNGIFGIYQISCQLALKFFFLVSCTCGIIIIKQNLCVNYIYIFIYFLYFKLCSIEAKLKKKNYTHRLILGPGDQIKN